MSKVVGQLLSVTVCCWALVVGSSTDGLAATPEQKIKRLCGPACVVFCARWLGVQTDTVAVAELAKTTDEGTSLGGLAEAVTALGLEGRNYSLGLRHLRYVSTRTPGIAHVDGDHFVVAWMPSRKEDAVMVVDPPNTVEKMSLATFAQRWTGAILIVSRPGQQPRWPLVSGPCAAVCCAVLGVGLMATWRWKGRGVALFRKRAPQEARGQE